MLKQTKFLRKGKQILELDTHKIRDFESISSAKRESAMLQKKEGGLGLGTVKVVKKWPSNIGQTKFGDPFNDELENV